MLILVSNRHEDIEKGWSCERSMVMVCSVMYVENKLYLGSL